VWHNPCDLRDPGDAHEDGTMIRKLVATVALLVGTLAVLAPASPAAAGGGPPDYASCVITVEPSTFPPGASVVVTGSAFQPNFETTLMLGQVPLGTVMTDATGAFQTTVTIPDDAAPGANTISAACDAQGNVTSTDVTISGGDVSQPTTPGGSGGGLPRTGSDAEPLVVAGAAALLAGITFVLIAGRRRRTSTTG